MNFINRRKGLSLLEVMLALAIFGTSMVALGELIRIGARCANDARDLTTAQLYCESLMAEITAGYRMPDPITEPTPVEVGLAGVDQNWLYTVQVAAVEQPGLVSVTVTVERNLPNVPIGRRPSFALLRWIKDPGIVFETPEAESGTTSSSGTTTPTTSGTAPAGGASG